MTFHSVAVVTALYAHGVTTASQERRKFDREFKIETVRLMTERGMSVAQVSRDLDIHENVLRTWKNQYAEDVRHAFPGKGRLITVCCQTRYI
jgi:transposase-like protein